MRRSSFWFIILFLLLVLYLNRAYAHMYQVIGTHHLSPPSGVIPPYTLSVFSPPFVPREAAPVRYVALGDSLTAGVGVSESGNAYPYLVGAQIGSVQKENVEILNTGVPGARALDVLQHQLSLPLLTDFHPQFITLLIGVNDVHNFTSLAKFQTQLEAISTQLATRFPSSTVLFIAAPYIGAPTQTLPPYNWLVAWRTRSLNGITQLVARRHGFRYSDLYTPTYAVATTDHNYYSADLFHPNDSGYALWSKIIYADLSR